MGFSYSYANIIVMPINEEDEQAVNLQATNFNLPFKTRVLRFGTIGIFNTLLDVVIYTLLRRSHLGIVEANICSTTIALGFSFILNRKYTFYAHGHALHRQLVRFLIITLVALWVLQPIVIYLVDALNHSTHILSSFPLGSYAKIYVPKLVATAVSLVWNFLWYKNFVFTNQ